MSTDSSWSDYLSTGTDGAMDTTATGSAAGTDAFVTPATESPVVESPVVESPVIEFPATESPVVPEAVVDAVESDIDRASAAQEWSDWHAATGDSWANSAQDYIDYAHQNAAAGYGDIANSSMEVAANHAAIADANFSAADDFAATAGSHLDVAAQELAPYDSGASFGAE